MLFANHMCQHTGHWKLWKKGEWVVCLHSLYPVPVKMYYENEIYNEQCIQWGLIFSFSFNNLSCVHQS
jgi:hypothetical protein